jgi:membrane-associated protease RseP (regulator of RpoE activity)
MIMKFIPHAKLVAISSIVIIGVASAVPQELVDGLGDESYQLREKSEQELSLWAKKKGEEGLNELDAIKKKSPSPEVRSRIDNVISGITVYKPIPGTQGFMGISMQSIMGGSVILSVSPDTPAEKCGLQANDKIIELDGIDLTKKNNHVDEATDFLRMYVKSKKAGEKLSIKINRQGDIITKELKLADYSKQMARLGLDPFGNGGVQILPMQGGFQGNLRINPRPAPRNIAPQQLKKLERQQLERNLRRQEQLLERAELPEEFKETLRKMNKRQQEQLEQLEKELDKLKEKEDPKK